MRSAALVVALTFAGEALAGQGQPILPKGQIEIDGAYRVTSRTFVDTATPTINAEPARITTSYKVPAAMVFTGSGAMRIWRRLGIGASVSRYSAMTEGNITASIPHPLVFSRAREIQGVASDLKRQELGIAVQLRGFVPLSRRLSMSLSGGPVWISVAQDVVTDVQYSEAYPYDSASYRSNTETQVKKTKLGLGVGGDVAYFFSKQIGLGVGVRFSGGTIELPSISGTTLESKIGGLDVGAGLRVRF